ncbi:hypothetical protein K439DRAFT_1658651 [Ramaria rubella]|nr:hypothetical protein K439DRAFT_1658651 [Ramaria rubella]
MGTVRNVINPRGELNVFQPFTVTASVAMCIYGLIIELQTYTIENAEYDGACLCYCGDCRRGSGSAFSFNITVQRSGVSVKGDYKEYLTTGASTKLCHRIICPNCGSQIANFPDFNKDIVYIKAGTLSEDIQKTLKPDVEASPRISFICLKMSFDSPALYTGPLALHESPIRSTI